MIKTVSYRITIVVAALLLALTSVSSAARMAPSDLDTVEVAAFLAVGGTLDDLCDDGQPHNHAEHCPFCNTVAQADLIAPTGKVWSLAPDPLSITFAAAPLAAQRHAGQNHARGPPTAA